MPKSTPANAGLILSCLIGLSFLSDAAAHPLCDEPAPVVTHSKEALVWLNPFVGQMMRAGVGCVDTVLAFAQTGDKGALQLLAGSDDAALLEGVALLARNPLTSSSAPAHLEALSLINDDMLWAAWVQSIELRSALALAVDAAVDENADLLRHWPTDTLLGFKLDNGLAKHGSDSTRWGERVSRSLIANKSLLEVDHMELDVNAIHGDANTIAQHLHEFTPHQTSLLIRRWHDADIDTLIDMLEPDPAAPEVTLSVLARKRGIDNDDRLEPWIRNVADHWQQWMSELLPDELRGRLEHLDTSGIGPDSMYLELLIDVLEHALDMDEVTFLAAVARHPDPDIQRIPLFPRLDAHPDTDTIRKALDANMSAGFLAAHFDHRMFRTAFHDFRIQGAGDLGLKLIGAAPCQKLDAIAEAIDVRVDEYGWADELRRHIAACRP